MSIHLTHNPFINRNVNFINNIHEQGFSTFEKVKSFSESYMVSYLSKALVASITLSYLGFSFGTVFSISLALIVFANFMSFALGSVKEAIHALAQKSKAYLTRIAQVISNIFEAICAFISSFASRVIDFKALSFAFDKKLPVNYAVVTDNEAFIEETISHLVLPHLQSCVALEKSADLVSIKEAPLIQEDTQTVTQQEPPEIEKKAKKSEILSKFDQLCAFSEFGKAFNYPSQQLQNQKPLQLATFSAGTMPRATLPKSDRNLESQRLIMTPPPISPNLSSIRFGMKALHLAKNLIK